MKRISLTLLALLLIAACSPLSTAQPGSAPLPTSTAYTLVTAAANATSTATPFLPVPQASPSPTQTNPPTPATATAQPTFDTSSVLDEISTLAPVSVPANVPSPVPDLTDNQTVTFLLLGSDARPGDTYWRTDTILVVAARPNIGQVTLISIPRDLWVYIPTVGMQRINTAYEYGEMYHYPGGGPGLLKATILYNLGIRIDHYAVVGFTGFTNIVNTLGGIDVPVACAETDWHLNNPNDDATNPNNWSLYTVGPGLVHMNGDLALWYARSRETTSNFDRDRRQQEVLRALYVKALQMDVLSKIPQLFSDFSSAVTTDMGLDGLLKLAPFALHLTNADIRSFYIGSSQVTSWTTPAGADVLLPNAVAIQALLQQALSPSRRLASQAGVTIEIRNGTATAGLDALAAARLNYAGFNTRLAPADRQNYSQTLLYDLSSPPDPATASTLLAVLGLPKSAYVSAPRPSDVPFVLILGADYQPCFNPANLAP